MVPGVTKGSRGTKGFTGAERVPGVINCSRWPNGGTKKLETQKIITIVYLKYMGNKNNIRVCEADFIFKKRKKKNNCINGINTYISLLYDKVF